MKKRHNFRSATKDDSYLIFEWRNQPRVRNMMFSKEQISWSEHSGRYALALRSEPKMYFIFELDSRPVGIVQFSQFDSTNLRCHWGYYMGTDPAPPMSAKQMAFSALELVFEDWNYEKLVADVLDFNERSQRYLIGCGFHLDGILRHEILGSEAWHDVHRYSLLREEWLGQKHEFANRIGLQSDR